MENVRRNILGTISFAHVFPGMRKKQEFSVYPKHDCDDSNIIIQSSTRIGIINTQSGEIRLSKSHPCGAYFLHLDVDKLSISKLDDCDLLTLRNAIIATGDNVVGNSVITTCNIGALTI